MFSGTIWQSLGRHAREIQECCKHRLTGDSNGSSEDQNGDKNGDSRGKALVVSKGNKDYLESWNRAHSYYVLINNLFTCFLCPETLQETEFKGDRLIWRKKKNI